MATKVKATRQNIQFIIDKTLSPQARSAQLIAAAQKVRDELITTHRASASFKTFVDGSERSGKTLPRGLIVQRNITYQFNYLGAAAAYAIEFLLAYADKMSKASHDPDDPTPYRDSFMIAVNGKPQPVAGFKADQITILDEIIIYNRQPYGRKADTQQIGGKPMKPWVMPPYIFKNASAAVNKKYGKTVNCMRYYTVNVPNQWRRKTGKKRGKNGRLVEYPALKLIDGR